MTNKEAKEKLYMEWQKFLENNIDYAGISEAYKMGIDAVIIQDLGMAERIKELMPEDTEFVTDRSSRRCVRPQNEIGISSIRCGGIFGEHEVILSRNVKHQARSRKPRLVCRRRT